VLKFTIYKTLVALSAFVLATALLISTVLAQTQPTLKVITPSEGQTIYGSKIPILISIENFNVVDFETNTLPKNGEGHVHLWLDDPNPTAESAVKLVDDNFTYSDVSFGEHTVRAELVNNNHTPLRPPIVTTLKFKSAPAASPVPPQESKFDKNTALIILVIVSIVIIAAWWYTKDEEETPEKSNTTTKKPIKKTSKKKTNNKSKKNK
jgi:hypothetical protein